MAARAAGIRGAAAGVRDAADRAAARVRDAADRAAGVADHPAARSVSAGTTTSAVGLWWRAAAFARRPTQTRRLSAGTGAGAFGFRRWVAAVAGPTGLAGWLGV